MYFEKSRILFVALVAVLSSYNATAAKQFITTDGFAPALLDKARSSLVASLSAGPVWEHAGQTQTFYLTPEIEKTYVANNNTNTLADGEFFIGVQGASYRGLEGQLGFAVATTSNANLSGNIWDDADPTFDNFIYGYQVQHTHIAVKGKLLTDHAWYTLKPYVSGSVGVGFNRAQNFRNIPTIFEAVVTPNFGSHTSTAFTYTVGVGLQKILDRHLQIGVGYEFADWGRSQLSRASGQTLNTGLSLSHLYTNGLLFNLTYLA
jgi:opacity protein-like surface antigen